MKKTSFLLVKNQSYHDIKDIDYNNLNGYHFRPMNNTDYSGVTVTKMVMINPSFVEKVLRRKITKRLDLYLRFIISIIDSDDDSTDITNLRAALNDLTRYKEIVKAKYAKYLDEKYKNLLLKKIELLEGELSKKIMYYKAPEEDVYEEEHRRTR